jgi:hypothetical protein
MSERLGAEHCAQSGSQRTAEGSAAFTDALRLELENRKPSGETGA